MENFRECGFPAFLALGVGMLATLVGVVALALALMKPRTGMMVGVLALAMSLGAPGVGFIGMIWGRQRTDAAISGPSVSPEFKEKIREVGYAEAAQCVPIGASLGALPLVMAALAIVVGLATQKSEKRT